MKSEADLASGWLRKGDSDLCMASGFVGGDGPFDTVCFHAQQAAEKYLKAVIALHSEPIPKTHELTALAARCAVLEPALDTTGVDLIRLTNYAVKGRYELDFWPDRAVAEEAIRMATACREAVLPIVQPETFRVDVSRPVPGAAPIPRKRPSLRFYHEEYRTLRREIDFYGRDIRRVEYFSVIACFGVYAWLATNDEKNVLGAAAWFIPMLVPILASVKCDAERVEIYRAAEYIKKLERFFNGSSGVRPEGWENFLERLRRQESEAERGLISKYSAQSLTVPFTNRFWIALFLLTLLVPIVRLFLS